MSQHALRGARQRCAVVCQSEQGLLERMRRFRNQRQAARAMNAAQRMARAHHLRCRRVARIGVQQRKPAVQCADMCVGFVAQNLP